MPTLRDQAQERYEMGYETGHLDRTLGIRVRYAEAPEHDWYAVGYRDGVLGLPKRKFGIILLPRTVGDMLRAKEQHVRGHRRKA